MRRFPAVITMLLFLELALAGCDSKSSSSSESGIWNSKPLQPGEYTLSIVDANGSDIAQEQIALEGGLVRRAFTLAPLEVRGRLLAGDDGLAATIQFDDRKKGRRVVTKADGEGSFFAEFPEDGEWQVLVYLSAVNYTAVRVPPVNLTKPHDAELILRIPGGRIEGKVIDGDGREIAGAVVRAKNREQAIVDAHTADDGTFALPGLGTGTYTIEAQRGDAFAPPVGVVVEEDTPAKVLLRLEAARELAGLVLAANGSPASGAVVRTRDPMTGREETAVADGRGLYTIKVRPDVQLVDVIVMSPPHPIAIRRVALGEPKSSVPVQLTAAGAKVRIRAGSAPPWPKIRLTNGIHLDVRTLMMPTFGTSPMSRELVGGAIELSLEPGRYAVCNASGDCRHVLLAPHGETEVNLLIPAPAAGGR